MEIISLTEILNAIKADTGTKTIPLAHLCVEPNLKRRAGFWLFSIDKKHPTKTRRNLVYKHSIEKKVRGMAK